MDDSQEGYIHTPKPQIQSVEPRKGRLGTKAIPVFLVKREKSRDFDVFFWSVFWCLEERKSVERCWAEGPISEKCFSSWLGALYSPGREFQGESPWRFSGLKRSIIWFFLTPLDRY